MRKVRVYQLARELKLTNEALLSLIQEIDPSITSHTSSLEAELVEKVRQAAAEAKKGGRKESAARAPEVPAQAPEHPRSEQRAEPETVPIWKTVPLPRAPRIAGLEELATVDGARVSTPPPALRLGPALTARGAPRILTPEVGGRTREFETKTYRPEIQPVERGPARAAEVRSKKGRKRKKRREVDEKEVFDRIRRTMATLEVGHARKRRRKRTGESGEDVEEANVVKLAEFSTVGELAAAMEVRPAEVVAACLRLGIVANVNRRLDRDSMEAVADEFGYTVEFVKEIGEELEEEFEEEAEAAPEEPRPPIVTVMGHVDHGKTKLLDYIRRTDVVSGESGGITQHIGAYKVRLEDGKEITFLDTPGHKAFTAMRARGADVTDIVVLVVAADDRVNEQTVEAINHARAAGKPIVVAINKCDLPEANPEKIRKELADYGLLVEEWGGDTVAVEISAKLGTNVDKLLEMILLVAEMLELKARVRRRAVGTVVEAMVDPGRGTVATVLVQEGTLRIGSPFVCGAASGKVRALINDKGEKVESAGPATPVEVLGWESLPQVGDKFIEVRSEAEARSIASRRAQIAREHRMRLAASRFRLDDLHARIAEGKRADLRMVIKGDTQGSVEVLRDSFEKLSSEKVKVTVVHAGVGKINESDVLLAATSNAVVIGFHVRPDPKATQVAQTEGVDIRLFKVIYEAIEEVKAAMEGLLEPKKQEKVLGAAEVRQIFKIGRVGTVAGCHVVSGVVQRQARARVIRGEDVVWTGRLASLKRFKDDVREVAAGYDCGIALDGFDDFEEGDLIESFVIEEVSSAS